MSDNKPKANKDQKNVNKPVAQANKEKEQKVVELPKVDASKAQKDVLDNKKAKYP